MIYDPRFTHVFSCGVVLGSIAMRPRMAVAPSALSHLESAHNLFSQITDVARASKMLVELFCADQEVIYRTNL